MSSLIAAAGKASRAARRRRRARSGCSGLFLTALLVVACNAGCSPDAASAGASGSFSAGGGSAEGALWTTNAGKYSLSLGSTYLELDPEDGARMTALRVGGSTGDNLLADSATTGQVDNWGSTFWPSPQNWAWPPTDDGSINALNTLPYTAVGDALTLTLTSQVNATPPTLSVIKRISTDVAKQAIIIDYTMTNGGPAPVTVAPWEVTRVAAGGITFYEDAGVSGVIAGTTLTDGVRWYKHDPSGAQPDKLFSDGKGWLTHAAGNLLLIKSFPDITPNQSPTGEAEIAIYSAAQYVEVENQGAVQTLAPGDALHWTVRWYARTLATPAVVGSADLVAYVQDQIK
ncbi:MAG: hypothetical protein ABIQ16_03690 [Polyangiaceae bacterium]